MSVKGVEVAIGSQFGSYVLELPIDIGFWMAYGEALQFEALLDGSCDGLAETCNGSWKVVPLAFPRFLGNKSRLWSLACHGSGSHPESIGLILVKAPNNVIVSPAPTTRSSHYLKNTFC